MNLLPTYLDNEHTSGGVYFNQFIYLKNRPVAKFEDKQIYAIHADHLGTPRIVTNDNKDTVWKADYSPFGKAEIKSKSLHSTCAFRGNTKIRKQGRIITI